MSAHPETLENLSPERAWNAPAVCMALGVFAFLTYLVWGIFALDRGMFQDETFILGYVNSWGHGIFRFLLPIAQPTRIFAGAPFALALFTPSPVATLQIFYGLTWFLGGVFAALVLAQIFPGNRWLAFAGGCLTICATGDYQANSLEALHYDLAALFYFVTLALLLAWLKSGRRRWIALSIAALAVSLGNTDVAFAPILLTPALLWLVEGRFSRRVKAASLAMACVFAPYLVVFGRFLLDPHSYAATAIEPISFMARGHRIAAAYFHNFAPWTWGRARRNWFPPPPSVVPGWIRLWAPVVGAFAFLGGTAWFLVRRRDLEREEESRKRDFTFLAAFLLMALACNSTHGLLQFSQYFFRSQILSRYWASLAIALSASIVLRLRFSFRWLGVALPLVFVGLGIDGGLDRQDYFLAYWRRHRMELRSIVEAAPRLAPSASLVLLIPERPPYYLATQADYLAQAWASLLYDDRSMWERTLLIGPYGDQHCSAEHDEIACRDSKDQILADVALPAAVILRYDAARNGYFLAERLPPEIASGSASQGSDYRPRALIFTAPAARMAERVLMESAR